MFANACDLGCHRPLDHGGAEEVPDRAGRCARAALTGIEVDLRLEAVWRRRVGEHALRRRQGPVAALPQQVARVGGRAGDAVPVQDDHGRPAGRRRLGAGEPRPLAECRSSRLLAGDDVGRLELLDRRLDVRAVGAQRVTGCPGAVEAADLRLEDPARRQLQREERPRPELVRLERLLAALPDLDVVPDDLRQLRDRGELERAREPLVEGAHEDLLPLDPVQVGVRVPVADERERPAARDLLVPRLEVDRRKGRSTAGVVVEVPPVDVDPDPAQLVDGLDESPVVDRHEVVDRQPGQLLDRLDGSLEPAERVRRVDRARKWGAPGAVDVDHQVARERHRGERADIRVRANQHDRVCAAASLLVLGPLPEVLAHDHRDRGAAGQRDVELLRSLADLRVLARGAVDVDHRLLAVEPIAARDADGERREGGEEEEQDSRDEARDPASASRLSIVADRSQADRRQCGVAVSIPAGRTTDSSLQRRPHKNATDALTGASRGG